MSEPFKALVASRRFQRFIIGVILFAGVLVGLETYPDLVARHGNVLHRLDQVILTIFVAEIVVKILAEGKKPWRYFADGWNVFDFIIVAVCFLPLDAQYVTVLRLARLLRVLKLVRSLPRLQVLVGALLRSLPSMGYVALLLFVMFYVYAVAATFLFGANDPIHFGNLQTSLLTLFRVVTLEGWTEILYIQMKGCAGYGYGGQEALCIASSAQPIVAAAFFVSFILLGTMVMLNLFIGVIMNGMSEAQSESADSKHTQATPVIPTLAAELDTLSRQLREVQGQLDRVARRATAETSGELRHSEA
ncbi:MAG: ion transporter [Deltaproteobacteria bacterium]|nr:ion transporter [Deltaproteobacteria bacterium]